MTSAGWQKTTNYPKIGSLSNAQRGDVLSFRGHVGIALGGGKMIDASSSRGQIRIGNLSTPYWSRNFVAGYRIF
jgi:cell wall-associated NlpC family hydrolase